MHMLQCIKPSAIRHTPFENEKPHHASETLMNQVWMTSILKLGCKRCIQTFLSHPKCTRLQVVANTLSVTTWAKFTFCTFQNFSFDIFTVSLLSQEQHFNDSWTPNIIKTAINGCQKVDEVKIPRFSGPRVLFTRIPVTTELRLKNRVRRVVDW